MFLKRFFKNNEISVQKKLKNNLPPLSVLSPTFHHKKLKKISVHKIRTENVLCQARF